MDAPVPDSPRSESDNSPAKQRERAAQESADRQRKLQEAKALLNEAEAISSVPATSPAGFASIDEHKDPEDDLNTSEANASAATDVPASATPARAATPPASDAAVTAAAASSTSVAPAASAAAPAADARPALSVRRSVLLDSLSDDEDDIPNNIGIGGPRKAGAVRALSPAPVPAATTPPAAAAASTIATPAPVIDDSAPTTKASLTDHLRAMEVLRRKEEDEKRARAAEEAEARRRKAEEDKQRAAAEQEQEQQRLKKEADDARQAEETRIAAAAAAAAAAEAEAKRLAAAADLARQTRESLEESTGSRGVAMKKIPRSGAAKLVTIKIEPDPSSGSWMLRWDSKSKKAADCCMLLSESEIVQGMLIGQFRKHKWRKEFGGSKGLALSFVGAKRSLELVAQSAEELELIVGLARRKGIKGYRDARGTKEEEEAVDK